MPSAPRFAATLAAVGLVAGSLAACQSDDSADTTSPVSPGASDSAFPATVKTRHGEVTIASKPTRIVTLDAPSLDAAQSLGAPVTTAMSSAMTPGKPDPWMKGKYTGRYEHGLINKDFTPNLEKIAAQKPDLILASTVQLKTETFKQLSQVAPVVSDVTTNDDWDARLRQIATATGSSGKVSGIVGKVEKAYTATGLDLKGKTYQWLRLDGASGTFSPGNGSWLDPYGMKPGSKQDNSMKARNVFSLETLDQIDADVVYVWNNGADPKKVTSDPRFKNLPSVTRGTFVWTPPELAFSVNVAGPNALSWAIDRTKATLTKAQN